MGVSRGVSVLVGAAVLFFGGCAQGGPGGSATPTARDVAPTPPVPRTTPPEGPVASASAIDPAMEGDVWLATLDRLVDCNTLQDIATYADAVVKVTVRSEAFSPPAPESEEVRAGEYEIARTVTWSIDDVLWQRAGSPTLPTSMTHHGGGTWISSETPTSHPLVFGGSSYPLGVSYVTALGQLDFSGAVNGWASFGGGCRTVLSGDRGALQSPELPDDFFMVRAERLSLDEIATLVREAKPDPRMPAEAFALPALLRSQMLHGPNPPGEPAPGEH